MSEGRIRAGRVPYRLAALAAAGALAVGFVACGGDDGGGGSSGGGGGQEKVTVGLITKTETNPFFVKMKEAAQKAAQQNNVDLVTASGKFDTDNASQVTALENMTTQGAKGILIVPSDSKAIVPSIQKARQAGVTVIALDTPPEPQSAVNALYATDNMKAGELIGQYAKAKAKELGITPKIAMLDLAPGISVGRLRHDGFLKGFGIKEGDPQIVGAADTLGATSQQYPQNMAADGVKAVAAAARGGKKPSGYVDTGVNLITADPAKGVVSKDVAYGTKNCWG